METKASEEVHSKSWPSMGYPTGGTYTPHIRIRELEHAKTILVLSQDDTKLKLYESPLGM